MAIEQDLQIFISWSGTLAREITKALRAWLPKMFDHIDPWGEGPSIRIIKATQGFASNIPRVEFPHHHDLACLA